MSTISSPTSTAAKAVYVSIPAAARYLSVSVPTIYRRIGDGSLVAYDISGPGAGKKTVRIAVADLDALLRPLDPTGMTK